MKRHEVLGLLASFGLIVGTLAAAALLVSAAYKLVKLLVG